MKYSGLTERVAGKSVDSWAVHYEGLARKAAGEDIIVLSIGQETEEATAPNIVQAAVSSLHDGKHHYTDVNGEIELREAIAKRHYELSGQAVDLDHCAIFSGAQNALFSAAQCLLEAGDEVILCEPFYTTYPATFTASGATAIHVPVSIENDFQIEPNEIIEAATDKTRAIVINTPNNPVGAVYSKDRIQTLVDFCVEKNIWLISDEVYLELMTPEERISAASCNGADQVCITVSSLSKSHRMTGWRLGWVVGPKELMKHLYNLSMCMAYGLPEFIQYAAIEAFNSGTGTAEQVRKSMDSRRKIVLDKLSNVQGMKLFGGSRGMFVVFDVSELSINATEFAQGLLDQYDVAILPCDGFGSAGSQLLRVSLTVDEDRLTLACDRILQYINILTK